MLPGLKFLLFEMDCVPGDLYHLLLNNRLLKHQSDPVKSYPLDPGY